MLSARSSNQLLCSFNLQHQKLFVSMGHIDGMINSKMIGENLCLVDSCTTHTILRDKKYFQNLILNKANVNTISGLSNLIESSGRANIILPKGTKFCIVLNLEEI
jgi:hypothetical protein